MKLLNKSLTSHTLIEKDNGFQILYPEKGKPTKYSIKIGEGETEWGAEKGKNYFVFIIHNFEEIKNEN